jgi:hypothetical protein
LPCKEVMSVRMGRFPRRTRKEFVRNLIWLLVVYAPVAAFLALWPVAPLRGVLLFGGVFVPVTAVIITVLALWGGDDEARFQDDPGWRSAGGYDPGHNDAGSFAGGSYHGHAGDGGGGDWSG